MTLTHTLLKHWRISGQWHGKSPSIKAMKKNHNKRQNKNLAWLLLAKTNGQPHCQMWSAVHPSCRQPSWFQPVGWLASGRPPARWGKLGRLEVSDRGVLSISKIAKLTKKSKLAHPITGRQLRGRRPSLVPLTSYVPRLNMSSTSIRLQQSCGATLIAEAMRYILMELSTTSWPESSVEVARDVWLLKRRPERLRNCFSGWIREALRIDSSLGILFGEFLTSMFKEYTWASLTSL